MVFTIFGWFLIEAMFAMYPELQVTQENYNDVNFDIKNPVYR